MTPYKVIQSGEVTGDMVSGADVGIDHNGNELHYKPSGELDPLGFYDKNPWAKEGIINPFKSLGNNNKYQDVINHLTDGVANSGANSSDDASVYGSTDLSGFDQAAWSLEQQWKLDQAERDYNSAEAAKQRDWEKMMSDTAVQRAVADIKAAGLNPWLALNGGSLGSASTPSGAAASSSSGSSKMPHNYLVQMVAALVSSASSIIKALL